MPQTFTTACPRNCYSTCGMRVVVDDAKLVAIEDHPGNRATAKGPCIKGLSYIERVYAQDRLLHPLERQTDGAFARIGWQRAFDRISHELAAARDQFGPQSVFYYTGSGTKGLMNGVGLDFWRLFGGCTTTYGDLCWPAGLEATRLTLGDNKHSAPWDMVNARLIVLWGKNPAETNIHQMNFIEEAVGRGARVIVVDPRRTQSAEGAELLIQPRPGTDGALALGVAHLLITRNTIDEAFIKEYVAGFAEYAAMVNQYTPVRVAEITDVPEIFIHRLAEAIGAFSPVTMCAGFGMQRYTNSAQTMRALIALLAITGNIGKPGAGWVYANLQSQIFGATKDPLAFFPPAEPDPQIKVSVSTARLGPTMLEQTDPALRVAWIERGNPVTQNPETHAVLEALRALDFRVVVDQFLTDTAREADIVLPAKTMFEQTDVINAYWHPYIQIKAKVIDCPGEVKPESEIYWHLAHRLGLPKEAIEACLPEPNEKAVESYLRARLEPWPELTLQRLREGPVVVPGHQEIAFSDGIFPTPSGKIELLSCEARERWHADELPRYKEPVERPGRGDAGAFPLHLLTPNTKDRIHSQFNNLPSIRQLSPITYAKMNPVDAAERGICEGERVRIFNHRGSVEIEVRFDHSLRPGCIVVSNGWWLSEGGGINRLSASRETDMAHGAAFHDNAVEVEKA